MKRLLIVLTLIFLVCPLNGQSKIKSNNKPNVVLILTDDQGYGDLGYHKNPDIKTPTLDAFASESIGLNNFYVSPVCSPTRASLLTGRYNIRTGVFDTFSGGSIMASSETTIAELLRDSGYTTGHFGKWHLGSNYPSRPQDQGFETSVWNTGGAIGNSGDPFNYYKKDSSYFNPVLWKNGKKYQSTGYCTDVWTDEAIQFIQDNRNNPFFMYLAYNAPHKPLQLPQEYYEQYKDKEINEEYFRNLGFYVHGMTEKDKEDARKVYGMVTNIDDNLNRLFKELKKNKLYDNTIIIFMTDNGPAQYRYTGGFKGKKSLVQEGGIHVPFYIKIPKGMKKVKEINERFAHIDVLPTIANLCDIQINEDLEIDGVSMVPYLSTPISQNLERPLFFEWQRSYPEKYKNIAVIKNGFKLIGNTQEDALISEFELYNLNEDPYEAVNIINKQFNVSNELKSEIDQWYDDIMLSPNIIDLPRIIIGNEQENTTMLNRNEARGIQEIRDQEDIYVSWDVLIERAGDYKVSCYFVNNLEHEGKLYFRIGNKNISIENKNTGIKKLVFDRVLLDEGKFTIDSWYSISITSYLTPFYLEIERLK
jgi:arylsulfatase A-like enzyme